MTTHKKRKPPLFQTPDWCVTCLLRGAHLPGGFWLEPAAGSGAIIRAANAVRNDIRWDATEINRIHRRPLFRLGSVRVRFDDFLATEPQRKRYDVILGNPPFSRAQAFVERSLPLADHVVLLLKLDFLASAARNSLLRRNPPDMYVVSRRPSFRGKGTDRYNCAWFHWRRTRARRSGGTVTVLPMDARRRRRVSAARSR